jgi:hypothetical protein
MRVFDVPEGDERYDGCGTAVAAISPDGQLVDFDYTNEEWQGRDAANLREDYPDCEVLQGTMSCWQFVVK